MNVRKRGGTVYIRTSTNPNYSMTSGTEYDIGIIPDNMRPAYNTFEFINYNSTAMAQLKILTSGKISFTPYTDLGTNNGVNVNVSYVI